MFICPNKHLQEKNFRWKKKQLHKISDIKRSFYQKFGERNAFSAEKYQHSCQNWTLRFQRDILEKMMFPKRKSIRKKFCTLSGVLFSVIEFVRHVYQKRVPVYNWRFWGKFFWNKEFFTDFFHNLRGKLSYFGNEFFLDYQKCVSLV